MFVYLVAEPGLSLLLLYLHLLSLNKDDHFLITSTYSLLNIYMNAWPILTFLFLHLLSLNKDLYLYLLSLNKDDHLLITSTYSLLNI